MGRPRTRKIPLLIIAALLTGVGGALSWPAKSTVSIYVLGAVVQPGKFELPLGSKIEDALAAAGGYKGYRDQVPSYIRVQERRFQKESEFRYVGLIHHPTVPLTLRYEDEKRLDLEDGWVIRVEAHKRWCRVGSGPPRMWP